jgi:hypothetical protein
MDRAQRTNEKGAAFREALLSISSLSAYWQTLTGPLPIQAPFGA